jgi:selenoprotein W-related protein
LAAELKGALPGQVDEVRLIPSGGGVFEVRNGEKLVFSKRQLGRFPDQGEIVAKLQSR